MRSRRLILPGDMSVAELSACALDGDLYRVDESWASVAEADTAVLRATAYRSRVDSSDLIAERLTAAWIWGARSRAPRPLQVCVTPTGRRIGRTGPDLVVRETRRGDTDVVAVGGVRVTTPQQTAMDLLRERGSWSPESSAAVAGLLDVAVVPAELVAALEASAGRPFGRLAQRRLAAVLEQSGFERPGFERPGFDQPALTR